MKDPGTPAAPPQDQRVETGRIAVDVTSVARGDGSGAKEQERFDRERPALAVARCAMNEAEAKLPRPSIWPGQLHFWARVGDFARSFEVSG
jgi:hypothetical protein